MIPALKAFFSLSLFAFLGTHARTLPEDIFKISNTHSIRWISIYKKPPTPPPPSPKVAPPHHPVTSISKSATGNPCDIISRRPKAPPPPPLYLAPPHIQTNAHHEWNSIFETKERTPADSSHPFPQAAPKHHQGELNLMNLCNYWLSTRRNYHATRITSTSPPARVAPPHIETSAYSSTGSLLSQSVAAI